jgi:hypothetical protein
VNPDLTDHQLADLVQQGCNAAEIAAYTGVTEAVARFRMERVMQARLHARPTRAHLPTTDRKEPKP